MAHLPKGQGVIPLPPFEAWLSSNIPAVYDNTMTYYEELCALLKYLQDQVVPALNENAEAITVLSEYVEHYFDNLDVQTEINNKLDEMAESGQLQEIVASYLQANVAWVFETVADMKAADNLVAGSYAQTLGFHTLNDGGGATYYITDTGTADEITIIACGDLYANLVFDKVNVKQFGAYGDDTHDDSTVFTAALTHKNVYIPKGTYKISENLTLLGDQKITGDKDAVIDFIGEGYLFTATTVNRFTIDGLQIECNGSNNAIEANGTSTGCADFVLSNIRILGANKGIRFRYCWDFKVTNVRINDSVNPLDMTNQVNNGSFDSCYFVTFTTRMSFTNCEGILFDSCDFANYSGTNDFLRLFQCHITLLNCYYENLGHDRYNIQVQTSEEIKTELNIVGGKVTLFNGTDPLCIMPSKAYVSIHGLKDTRIVSELYPSTVTTGYTVGANLSGLDIPEYKDLNRYASTVYFDGKYDVTFTKYGTNTLSQTFANGEKTLQYTSNTGTDGIQFLLQSGKNYLIEIDCELPNDYPTLVFTQSSGLTSRSITPINNKIILPVTMIGNYIRIYWTHDQPVKISKVHIWEV